MGSEVFRHICVILLVASSLQLQVVLGKAEALEGGGPSTNSKSDENEAIKFLEDLEPEYSTACNKQMEKRWTYVTDVTPQNEQASVDASNAFLAYQALIQQQIQEKFPAWNSFSNATVRREFRYLAIKGPGNMSPQHVEEMNTIGAQMETAYAGAKVCEYRSVNSTNCTLLSLDPELTSKLKNVSNYDELAYYWTAWHDKMAELVPVAKYRRFIELQNEYAKANKFPDMGELWAAPYDDGIEGFSAKTFEQEMYRIWEQLRPYYNKLHAYVRMKLRKNPLFADKISKFGYLPANLMGNMWAQDWTALEPSTKPFPNAPSLDATQAMLKKNYTADKMFEVADQFFQGLGLLPVTDTFKAKSMKVKPKDRNVVCHASAEDMCLGKGSTDFRIKMCTSVNQEDLVTVHHEMGHIQYFMQYTNEHLAFRDGANPGFHEAIGDTLALSVTTPAHLHCRLGFDMGLDENFCSGAEGKKVTETDLNFLYRMALEKFAFFPFAISMDSWRWGVFNGSITESNFNQRWWEIRQQNQGIVPPAPRNLSSPGLDPAAKYHIVANVEYIRYFVSHILQFQFYESLCSKAGQFNRTDTESKPLYQCDFAGSTAGGEAFGAMMQLGFSKPWPEALKVLTGSENLDISSLLIYFDPIFTLIENELQANGEVAGFGDEFEESVAKNYVYGHYEKEASRYCNRVSVTEFNYETNLLSQEAEDQAQDASRESSGWEALEFKANISQFRYRNFKDKSLQRQLKFMNAIGTSALDTKDLKRYNQIVSQMSKIYGTAKICPYTNQKCNITTESLSLEPDITKILSGMGSYDEMAYVWKAWRDASGKRMRGLFNEYIELSNKAAVKNGYRNMGDFWLLRYESDNFREELEEVWKSVRTELYEPLYNYVRFKLTKKYPEMSKTDPMPEHVFGNMWAQTWGNLLPFVLPHPTSPSFDITEQLKKLVIPASNDPHWTDERAKREMIFDYANTFFINLGLADMRVAYGNSSMILKPHAREVICHASAWDMCDKTDFRIKMCTELTHQDFITVHHELGHIQYYLQYRDLPITYRTGANPGFHEAIGDVVALSVSTPHHLEKVGLLTSAVTEGSMLNYLMQIALEKIAFLPFGYLIDSYRWQVFSGRISQHNLTYNWMKMRAEYQGIIPPFKRDEEDFDAGSKYHVASDTPYIRYFVSFILQFQIHEKLCQVAGHPENRPLHECDVDGNAAAGKLFGDILKAGASKNWRELLKEFTGDTSLNPGAIIKYFKPLIQFLKETQEKEQYPTGWDSSLFNGYYDDGPVKSASTETLTASSTITVTTTASPIASTASPTTTSTTTESITPSTASSSPGTLNVTSATTHKSKVLDTIIKSTERPNVVENVEGVRKLPLIDSSDDAAPKPVLIAVGVTLSVCTFAILAGYFAWSKFKN